MKNLEEKLNEYANTDRRISISKKENGDFFINRSGLFAKISADGKYSQPKGASWRKDIEEFTGKLG
jgi:hypothetical protein